MEMRNHIIHSGVRRSAHRVISNNMSLFSYVVARDTGFAPNPSGGYCTLANCKFKKRW